MSINSSGALHLDVFRQRLEDEAGEEVITTRPFIPIQCKPLMSSLSTVSILINIKHLSSIQKWSLEME